MIPATTNLPAAAQPTPISRTPAGESCPKCGTALIDPLGLGWCNSCGYCKSLAEGDAGHLLANKKGASLGRVVAAGGAIYGLPLWFWASLVFVAIGILFSVLMDWRLPEGNNLHRATWASVQIAAGVLVIFLAQCSALVMIAPEESAMSFKDAVVPFKLWGLVIKRLPRHKECLWAALLGLSLIVGSAAFIGGLQHWLSYLPKSLVEQEKEQSRAPQSGGGTSVVIQVD